MHHCVHLDEYKSQHNVRLYSYLDSVVLVVASAAAADFAAAVVVHR